MRINLFVPARSQRPAGDRAGAVHLRDAPRARQLANHPSPFLGISDSVKGANVTCLPLSFIIMGPISSLLAIGIRLARAVHRRRRAGICLGLRYFLRSASRPEEAPWLRARERAQILAEQATARDAVAHGGYRAAILDRQVLLISATYCFWLMGAAGLFMWVPAIIKSLANHGVVATGLLASVLVRNEILSLAFLVCADAAPQWG
jgi:hypothetical protein